MKTIRELLRPGERVYVYLKDKETGNEFMKQAEKEGFTFCDGELPCKRSYSEIMAVNDDITINYVNFIGRMAYGSGTDRTGDKKLIRVDYAEYIKNKLA